MKKIGIFTGFYIPHLGGVERYVDKLSASLMKLGYEIVIVTMRHDEGLPSSETRRGLKIYRLPIRAFGKNRYPIPMVNKEYKSLIQKIEDEKIEYFVVNTRFHLTSLIGAKIGTKQGRPVLLIEHGTDHFTINNKFLDYCGKIYEHILTMTLKKYVNRYYGVSKKCNLWLRHFSIHASGVFYNAIDPDDKKNAKNYYVQQYPTTEIVITYAGRLIKEKGILNLLDAFSALKFKHAGMKLKLVIAGDGDLVETIKNTYTDPSIETVGRLDFENVMSLFKRTDIFVYPSLYPEGLPTSILEAGLMGCAVVATPRGGTEEVITDGQHGIIVDGSVMSLTTAIEQLLLDPHYRTLLGQNIKHRVESVFTWDIVAMVVDKEIKKL